jgi:hypothetical protein
LRWHGGCLSTGSDIELSDSSGKIVIFRLELLFRFLQSRIHLLQIRQLLDGIIALDSRFVSNLGDLEGSLVRFHLELPPLLFVGGQFLLQLCDQKLLLFAERRDGLVMRAKIKAQRDDHEKAIDELQSGHEEILSQMQSSHRLAIEELEASHRAAINELQQAHDEAIAALSKEQELLIAELENDGFLVIVSLGFDLSVMLRIHRHQSALLLLDDRFVVALNDFHCLGLSFQQGLHLLASKAISFASFGVPIITVITAFTSSLSG